MLLTTSTTTALATERGYLLHKNPARVHRFEQSFGRAMVFYPDEVRTPIRLVDRVLRPPQVAVFCNY